MSTAAVVTARRGNRIEVRDGSGAAWTCLPRRRHGPVVVGDRVTVRPLEGGEAVIESVAERRSVLARPRPAGREQLIAANVDLLLVVIAVEPETPRPALDRHLVGAEHLGLDTALVLNKVDLRGRDRGRGRAEPDLGTYRRIGYAVFETSARTGEGVEALAGALRGRTGALAGLSGAGKSSLVRRLAPGAEPAVGALSRRGGQGRHTTSTAVLYALARGGSIIDSPGIRDFGEWPLPVDRIAYGYPEIRRYAGRCRFRDCRHLLEPGCAVAAAADIDPERLAGYRALVAAEPGG